MNRRHIKDLLAFKLGADPEIFIRSVEENRIVSAIPVLKRDKHNPIRLKDGIKFYADNTLAEFAFKPVNNTDEMMKTLKTCFVRMQEKLGDKYRIVAKAAHEFLPEDLKPAFGIDPQEIGCNVSYDAYKVSARDPVAFNDGFRSGSFHLHFGHSRLKDFQTRLDAVKLLDIFVGCSSVIFDPDPGSIARRARYGVCGEHRLPPWGLEWRVLSGGVLRSPKTTRLALDLSNYALNFIRRGKEKDLINAMDSTKVQTAINTCDPKLCEEVLTAASLPKALMARVKQPYSQEELAVQWGV